MGEDLFDLQDYIDRSRIRSARRRKRSKREDFEKKLLKLWNEKEAIRKQQGNLGWTELRPPVQQGYERFFVLRDDVRRTKEAPFFQKLLDKINTRHWSSRKDFKKKRRRFGKKVYEVREQSLHDVCAWELKKFTEAELCYLYETTIHRQTKYPMKVYRFSETWRFVLRIQPNIISKVRVKDFDMERRVGELDRYFAFDNRRFRAWKLLDGSVQWRHRYWYCDIPKYRDPFRDRSFTDILSEHWPEKPQTKTLALNEGFCFVMVDGSGYHN